MHDFEFNQLIVDRVEGI